MMIKCIKGIMYKEMIAVRKNIKSILLITVVFWAILFATAILKCNEFIISGVEDIKPLLLASIGYVVIFIAYVGVMSTLKFWQEKTMDALDSLFSLPISIRQALIAKVLCSVYIGIICFVFTYIGSVIIFAVYFKTIAFSIIHFVIMLAISIIFNFSYGIINGFCMWQLSVGAARIAQIFTYAIFLAGIIGLNSCITPEGFNMNVVYTLAIAMILLVIGAIYSLILINKEKVILNQID